MTDKVESVQWKPIYQSLDIIYKNLEDLEKGISPKACIKCADAEAVNLLNLLEANNVKRNAMISRIKELKKTDPRSITIEQVRASIAKNNMNTIGGFNARRETIAIRNTLQGVHYALEEGTQTVKEILPLIARVKESIKEFGEQIVSKVDTQLLDSYLKSAKEDSVEAASKFNNLSDAMQQAAKQIAVLQNADNVDKTVSRDIIHMTTVVQNNARDKSRMELAIKNAFSNDQNLTVVRGPIITDSRLEEMRLKNSNVEYDTVYFPGINFGTGFQQKEAVPRMYILREQLLVAIQVGEKPKFQFKLNKSVNKAHATEDAKFATLREDVVDMLASKLNQNLIDVTKEREGANYITSKSFPKVRFIWLVKKSVYDRLGQFTSGHQVGLPF